MLSPLTRSLSPLGVPRGAAAWSPLSIPGLQQWGDLSDISTLFQDAARTIPVVADGDPIGAVADKSGNGNHLIQNVTASKPTYKAAIKNGLSVARFATDDYLQGTTPIQPTSIISVYKSGGTGDRYLFDFRTGVANSYIYNGGMGSKWTGLRKNGAVVAVNPVNIFTGAWALNVISGTDTAKSDEGHIMSRYSVGVFGNGDLGEWLVYSDVLSAENILLLESYINTQWGIY